jgi:hypothetical protein
LNCTWEDGKVVATFREPFDMLAETTVNSNRLESGVTFKAAKTEIWLGLCGSNNRLEVRHLRMGENRKLLVTGSPLGAVHDMADGVCNSEPNAGVRRSRKIAQPLRNAIAGLSEPNVQ